ncbi:IS5 family transposase (plasmid) [Deinococcus sp. D7000]|nr:IS5 family transposase [Deinococcus sp. D7000]QLG13434.1 IS5 family transposase [Deinococcus sp. D7000]QLG13469.1 IS5 family transposase [Deinococcus sp. D7000]
MMHSRLERTLKMNRTRFKRRTGIYPETFAKMEAVLTRRECAKKKSGRPAALSPGEQLLLTLEFWREYRTFAHLGDDWSVHETTVQRTVERVETALIQSGEFRLPGNKSLKQEENVFQIIAVDAAETPCERPIKTQRRGYSGKKKRHTLKTQVVISVTTCMIMSVATAFGSMHDLTLFRHSGVRVHPETALIGDAGYQGIWRHHGHSITPHKETKSIPLTPEQRQQNRELASTRLRVEHVIRRLKIFRVLKDIYRHRRRRFSLRVNLIAAVCNRSIAGVA